MQRILGCYLLALRPEPEPTQEDQGQEQGIRMREAINAEAGAVENAPEPVRRVPAPMMTDVVLRAPQPLVSWYGCDEPPTWAKDAPQLGGALQVVIEMLEEIERKDEIKHPILKRKTFGPSLHEVMRRPGPAELNGTPRDIQPNRPAHGRQLNQVTPGAASDVKHPGTAQPLTLDNLSRFLKYDRTSTHKPPVRVLQLICRVVQTELHSPAPGAPPSNSSGLPFTSSLCDRRERGSALAADAPQQTQDTPLSDSAT